MALHRDVQRFRTAALALEVSLNVGGLKKLAALFPKPAPSRKAELVGYLAGQLDGDRLRALWNRLDELQRAAVSEAVHSPDAAFHAERFRAKYGRDPEWGSLDESRNAPKASPLQLFFCGVGAIPQDLQERLRTFVPAPSSATMTSLGELPTTLEDLVPRDDPRTRATTAGIEAIPLTVRETELCAQRDLFSVLRLIHAGKVSVSDKTRRPSAAAMKVVAGVLEGGDFYETAPDDPNGDETPGPIRAFAWPLLLQAARLAEIAGSRLRLTKAGQKALLLPPAAAIRTTWERWLGTTILDELGRIDCIKGQTGKGKRGLTALAGRRAAIRDGLADCPVGRWVATDELFRYMRAVGHDFEVIRDRWTLYISDPQYGALGYKGFGEWKVLQARYALCVLFEYAATLGLIDVAHVPPAGARNDFHSIWGTDDLAFFSRYDGLVYFRVTPLGAHCLSGAAYAATPATETSEPALGSDPEDDEGDPFTDRGMARLIECSSPALAARIAGDTRTRRLCLLAGDRHLVVPAASEPAFRRALDKLEVWPRR